MTIDDVLEQIRPGLGLEAEAEQDVMEEIRGHLEEAVAAGKARGLDDAAALSEAARALGVQVTTAGLRETHSGWGTLEGVAAAGLPVLFALVLRWLIFAPDGTAGAWQEQLSRPTLVIIAGVAILVPLLRFPKRRYALTLWFLFWGHSLVMVVFPGSRW